MTLRQSTQLLFASRSKERGNAYGEPVELELWQIRGDRATPVSDSRTGSPLAIRTRYSSLLLSLSPDAKSAVTIGEERIRATNDNSVKAAAPAMPPLQYRLIDLRSGSSTALVASLIASQASGRYRAAWAPDGAQVAITRLWSVPESRDSSKTQACDIALVRIGTPDARCVATSDPKLESVFQVNWLTAAEIDVRGKAQFRWSS
jgi:hypothetical protein